MATDTDTEVHQKMARAELLHAIGQWDSNAVERTVESADLILSCAREYLRAEEVQDLEHHPTIPNCEPAAACNCRSATIGSTFCDTCNHDLGCPVHNASPCRRER